MRSLTIKFLGVLSALTAGLCCNCFANELPLNSSQHAKPLTKELSFGGVEFSLVSSDNNYSQPQRIAVAEKSVAFRPEISLFTTAKSSQLSKLSNNSLVSRSHGKNNRYKNTIPAVYRLTLKGYSIVEYSNYKTDAWTFSKVKNDAIKKPQIMFSITKQF